LTCFGAVAPSSGSALLVLAKVTVVKIANYNTSVCGDVAEATSPYTSVFCLTGYFNNCNFSKHE